MAKGSDVEDLVKAALVVAGVVGLAYVISGRGKNNSPFIPDSVEDAIDRAVAQLNETFGPQWVDMGLDILQRRLTLMMPGVAFVLNAVYQAEHNYRHVPRAGSAKKRLALQLAPR